MNILVIKQTSLGDVLHSTGHVRSIKEQYPQSHLVLLTARASLDIYRNNPWVDEIILFDYYRVKREWRSNPVWCWQHIRAVVSELRRFNFDLAFDLQGLARSVLFLYLANAKKKWVKGNWPFLKGFRRKQIHAISEMDGVLTLAGIDCIDTSMEFATAAKDEAKVDRLLKQINPDSKSLIILSPFSRWQSKDWPLSGFAAVAQELSGDAKVIFTGAPDRKEQLGQLVANLRDADVLSLAGQLSLNEFAALVKRARLMLTGDSFPMHMASACDIRVVALFGPTDERKVGPGNKNHVVIRAPDCNQCDRRDCVRQCLGKITPQRVLDEINVQLSQSGD